MHQFARRRGAGKFVYVKTRTQAELPYDSAKFEHCQPLDYLTKYTVARWPGRVCHEEKMMHSQLLSGRWYLTLAGDVIRARHLTFPTRRRRPIRNLPLSREMTINPASCGDNWCRATFFSFVPLVSGGNSLGHQLGSTTLPYSKDRSSLTTQAHERTCSS